MRETGAICRLSFPGNGAFFGSLQGPLSSIWHYNDTECPFQSLLPLGENQVLKRHRPKYSRMLCFAVCRQLDQIDMISVKSRPTKPLCSQKMHNLKPPPLTPLTSGRWSQS